MGGTLRLMSAEANPKPKQKRREKTRGEICLNCEAPINTKYCPHCGQENVHSDHSVAVLVRDFFTEIAYYDSKLWLTLRTLLLHPGRLSAEWAQGKRMKYVSPIKLYLWITFVFFLAMALRGSSAPVTTTAAATSLSRVDVNFDQKLAIATARHDLLAEQVGKLVKVFRASPQAFIQSFRDQIPRVLFVILPMLALGLKLLYWRQRKYFVDHLVFVLHLHSCIFLVLLISLVRPAGVTQASPAIAMIVWISLALLFLWIVGYGFVAQLRFYGQPFGMIAIKNLVLCAYYGALMFVGVVLALLIAVNSMPSRPG